MSSFDAKWKTCVARARQATGRNETAPFGFSTRVLSAVAAQRPGELLSLELVWQRLTMRSLRWIGILLLICAILELPHFRERKPLEPCIEDTMTQLVWQL